MTTFLSKRAAAAMLAAVLSVTALSSARADIKDYEFRLLQPNVKQGDDAIVAVQLFDKRSGKAVPDAVIFATRIDMAPAGMPTMTAPIAPMTSPRTAERRVGKEGGRKWCIRGWPER